MHHGYSGQRDDSFMSWAGWRKLLRTVHNSKLSGKVSLLALREREDHKRRSERSWFSVCILVQSTDHVRWPYFVILFSQQVPVFNFECILRSGIIGSLFILEELPNCPIVAAPPAE